MNNIFIVGTVHFMSKVITPDAIYDKLCELKPDIILNEIPLDCDNDIIGWIKACSDFTPHNEGVAVLRYLESHEAILRAYDIKGLHAYVIRNKLNQKDDVFEAKFSEYFKASAPHPIALLYKKQVDKFRDAYGRWDKLSLAEMNSPECDLATEVFFKINMLVMPAILELVPELRPYKAYWLRRERYEIRRDKAMVKNILGYNQQYENQNIVVLCGYFHRYAIIQGLIGKQKMHDFRLIV